MWTGRFDVFAVKRLGRNLQLRVEEHAEQGRRGNQERTGRQLAESRKRAKISAMLNFRLVLVTLFCLLAAACGKQPAYDVVLITLDTTRADRLGAYGYDGVTSPNFDAVADDSILFERALSQSVLTSPSHLSMLTGLRPHSHGALFNGERMTTERQTLSEILGARGYETAAFVSGVVLAPEASDVSRGFDHFDAEFPAFRRSAKRTTAAALAWLAGRDPQAPFFLFVHYYDAHGPFRAGANRLGSFRRNVPPRPADIPDYQRIPDGRGGYHDDLEYYSDLYDASIREQDEALGRLLRGIDPNRSVVIITADHGESLAERLLKVDHGTYVFGEQTHIPLLMRIPGFAPRRFGGLVETTDLVPSLFELLGIDIPGGSSGIDGHSFIAALDAPAKSDRDHAVSIAAARASAFGDRGYELDPRLPVASILAQAAPHWKLIRYPGARGPIHELYRLETDPGERVDLAKTSPAALRELSDQLDAELPRLGEQLRAVLDEELQQQLEALGYIQ